MRGLVLQAVARPDLVDRDGRGSPSCRGLGGERRPAARRGPTWSPPPRGRARRDRARGRRHHVAPSSSPRAPRAAPSAHGRPRPRAMRTMPGHRRGERRRAPRPRRRRRRVRWRCCAKRCRRPSQVTVATRRAPPRAGRAPCCHRSRVAQPSDASPPARRHARGRRRVHARPGSASAVVSSARPVDGEPADGLRSRRARSDAPARVTGAATPASPAVQADPTL